MQLVVIRDRSFLTKSFVSFVVMIPEWRSASHLSKGGLTFAFNYFAEKLRISLLDIQRTHLGGKGSRLLCLRKDHSSARHQSIEVAVALIVHLLLIVVVH